MTPIGEKIKNELENGEIGKGISKNFELNSIHLKNFLDDLVKNSHIIEYQLIINYIHKTSWKLNIIYKENNIETYKNLQYILEYKFIDTNEDDVLK